MVTAALGSLKITFALLGGEEAGSGLGMDGIRWPLLGASMGHILNAEDPAVDWMVPKAATAK